ncbi:MAG: DNA gyrase subunit A [Alphaproteobacteria bacterium]|nr:DNA gyrase subunit A [Alphaproteobacteria bacterium]
MTTQNDSTDLTHVKPVTIEEEMKSSYLAYAMSVIVSRALPDLRDGLKPVHRRILYVMKRAGWDHSKPFRKSARVVGDVIGQYHPHGTDPIYESMVRMAQNFSMRLPLIQGQGNFGSVDGDPPAAMRYTEARLAKAADPLLEDIDKDTVEFRPNFDNTLLEPIVLPAQYPNLLVNGASGIAVGMATNIPPHNLGEVIDACCAFLDDPTMDNDGLMAYVLGPDFPTGGIIIGRVGIGNAIRTGRGSIMMRGKVHVEPIRKDREAIIITEIPYQVNKARMVERIAECVRDKLIEGISDIRDESDRDGMRVVVEIKRDAMSEIVLNQLYRYTPLQQSFSANVLALNNGRPEMLSLRDIIANFLEFRVEVVTRRTRYELNKVRDRAHLLVGLVVAVANIDEIIDLIRKAPDPGVARQQLMERVWPAHDVEVFIRLIDDPLHPIVDGTYKLSEAQARGILELRLQRLTGLERDKIGGELKDIGFDITKYLEILGSRDKLIDVIRQELLSAKAQFATPRLTMIEDAVGEQTEEDLIQPEDMVVTVSHAGYVKRVPLTTYRAQRRGGKGRAGMTTRDEDFVEMVFVVNTHTTVLFFTSVGKVYELKVYKLPLGTATAKGKAFVNLLPLDQNESITTILPLPQDESEWEKLHIVFATSQGTVRRNLLTDFVNIKANGKIAMKLEEGDRLVGVKTCDANQDFLLATRKGKAIRFDVNDVRVFTGRNSVGVRGIRLAKGDSVISLTMLTNVEADSMERDAYLKLASQQRRALLAEGNNDVVVEETSDEATPVTLAPERFAMLESHEQFILTITERGFGKRSSAYDYRQTGRGGQGIRNLDLTIRNGEVVASFPVEQGDQVVLVTDAGKLIRVPVNQVRIAGRATQGVTLFKVDIDEKVVSVSPLRETDDDDIGADVVVDVPSDVAREESE